MVASFAVELTKLRKRPATLVVGLMLWVFVVLFGYLLSYALTAGDLAGGSDEFARVYYPKNLVCTVLEMFNTYGAALALVLGALSVGSEYGWQTHKLVLTQGPGRIAWISGKVAAVLVVIAAYVAGAFALGAASSYAIAVLQGHPARWPAFGELLAGLGAGWLILATHAFLGVFLGTLIRGNALAIGLGLVYLLIVQQLFLGFAPQSELVAELGEALQAQNALSLANSFDHLPNFESVGSSVPTGVAPAGPERAATVLGVYTTVFVALSMLLFRRRDLA